MIKSYSTIEIDLLNFTADEELFFVLKKMKTFSTAKNYKIDWKMAKDNRTKCNILSNKIVLSCEKFILTHPHTHTQLLPLNIANAFLQANNSDVRLFPPNRCNIVDPYTQLRIHFNTKSPDIYIHTYFVASIVLTRRIRSTKSFVSTPIFFLFFFVRRRQSAVFLSC